MTFPNLNIEGAVVVGSHLKLFQRGNGRAGKNAMIDISLEGLFEELKSSRELSEQRIQAISILELGELHGTPLGFTDAAVVMDNEIAFLAVAEQTDSTYTDGQYVGAMLGYLNSEGRLGKIVELNCPQKPEGIWLSSDSGCREFFVVTDADDRSQPSLLYRGML
jgi:hypothetical protein